MKNIFFSFLYTFILFITLSLILTTLNYLNTINYNGLVIGKMIIPIISLIFSGILTGMKANKNGWLEGIKIGFMITSFCIIATILFDEINIKKSIYFLILIFSAIFGSIIGINKFQKKTPN